MDLEGVVLSELSGRKKKQILYVFTYMWNLKTSDYWKHCRIVVARPLGVPE